MNSFKSKIESIIEPSFSDEFGSGGRDPALEKTVNRIINEFKLLVGEDEEWNQQEYDDTENGGQVPFLVRNRLRQEILTKISED